MKDPFIAHSDIRSFAEARVNLPSDSARRYREQVNRLRESLAEHIVDNPDFALVQMLHGAMEKCRHGLPVHGDDLSRHRPPMAVSARMRGGRRRGVMKMNGYETVRVLVDITLCGVLSDAGRHRFERPRLLCVGVW